MIQLSKETLRKIKYGLIVQCECGRTHAGKYEKCQACRGRDCDRCGKRYTFNGSKICTTCVKKRAIKVIT